ncbi:MAG: hemerythrin domain-containing protein [Planctomycetes bacterium]|nr:hemerythrin domain-containing protein [Planctomycetota bacterium]
MKLTDALLGEHAVIYELFGYVRDTVANTNDVQEIQGAVSVLERLLLSHAKVEEDLLFPRLEPYLGQMGPLAVMREEHRGLDDLLKAAKQETDAGALKSVIDQLLELAYGHFQKEEEVLFAMAQQFLDEATLTELGDEWAARRKVIVDGQGCLGAA